MSTPARIQCLAYSRTGAIGKGLKLRGLELRTRHILRMCTPSLTLRANMSGRKERPGLGYLARSWEFAGFPLFPCNIWGHPPYLQSWTCRKAKIATLPPHVSFGGNPLLVGLKGNPTGNPKTCLKGGPNPKKPETTHESSLVNIGPRCSRASPYQKFRFRDVLQTEMNGGKACDVSLNQTAAWLSRSFLILCFGFWADHCIAS